MEHSPDKTAEVKLWRPMLVALAAAPALLVCLLWSVASVADASFQLNGYAGVETRLFAHAPASAAQDRHSWSLLAKPRFRLHWDDGAQAASFVPFVRWDSADSERTHWDIRELYWELLGKDWELRIGIDRVFWGVMESQHLVDFINQTDLVENPDGEDKLGQPMINLSLARDFGTLDLFVLPGFRERTFPGRDGRLRSQPFVDSDREDYESSRGQAHVDFAVRWSHFFDNVDVGLYQFYGTSRDPTLIAGTDSRGNPALLPRYETVHQSGLDLQITQDNLLWKLEALYRAGQGDSFLAASLGLEYTVVRLLGSSADLGLLGEYHFNSDGESEIGQLSDDWFAGLRFSLNDMQSTEVLAGVLVDRTERSSVLSIEASRRLGDSWKAELEARLFSGFEPPDAFAQLDRDDYVALTLTRHF